jgi:hypothetical protein
MKKFSETGLAERRNATDVTSDGNNLQQISATCIASETGKILILLKKKNIKNMN